MRRLVWQAPRGPVEFALGETAIIGREGDADIQIQEPLVSRLHARLERRGEAWFLIDLGSTNLTRVNGAAIRERELQPGDEILFARARCQFLDGAAAAGPVGEPTVSPAPATRPMPAVDEES
jgi:pSer/pThr/pTyr-binding forkhead associated (FHA) protein